MPLDLNECESNSTNTCHEDAECHDTEGSYWCECGPGFTGDGYNCTGLLHFRGLHSTHMEFGRITTVLFIEVSLFQGGSA